jgi:membrane fusion protein (multidrug efflux system)
MPAVWRLEGGLAPFASRKNYSTQAIENNNSPLRATGQKPPKPSAAILRSYTGAFGPTTGSRFGLFDEDLAPHRHGHNLRRIRTATLDRERRRMNSASTVQGTSAPVDTHIGRRQIVSGLRWIAVLILMIVAIVAVFFYWHYRELYPRTEDAYASSGILHVTTQVSGLVTNVYVQDDERVDEDDPLFDIKSPSYDIALIDARAKFEAALSGAGHTAKTLSSDAIDLDDKAHALDKALKTYSDAKAALSPDQQPFNQLTNARKSWQDALDAFRKADDAFQKDLGDLAISTPATAKLQAATIQLDKAVNDWFHSHVVAPASGWLSRMTLQPGTLVEMGTPLFAIVKDDQWVVNANFKEIDLARVRLGQKATIRFDMYPDQVFNGIVEGISMASGSAFAMLSPDSATGNWVKVPQRFPVRIKITSPIAPEHSLRVGASAEVTVDTTSYVGQDGNERV